MIFKYLQSLSLILALVTLVNCAKPPWDREIKSLGKDKCLVLMRIICEVGGEQSRPFNSSPIVGRGIMSSLAGLETGGVPIIFPPRFFSSKTAKEGWFYYVLPPGYHYLAFSGPSEWLTSEDNTFDLRNRERKDFWQLDVPDGAQAIYGGTLRFDGFGRDFFGREKCEKLVQESAEIIDQNDLAQEVLKDLLPEMTLTNTSLVKHESKTFQLRSPLPIEK